MDSQAAMQAFGWNIVGSTQSVSGDYRIPLSSLIYHFHMTEAS